MARLKEIDDEPITQFGSQVDRMLAHHILALERAHNEREDPAEPVDAARCKCGHLSADHHTPKIAGMNNVLKFGCIQCGCSDFRSAEQEHREQNPHAEPEKILPSADELFSQVRFRKYWTPARIADFQQITIEAVCQWVEGYRGMLTWTAFRRILLADAARVVREAKGEAEGAQADEAWERYKRGLAEL